MKKMIIAFILLGWQLTATAQERTVKTPTEKATRFSTKMSKDLALSEDQKKKIYTLALSNFEAMEKIRAKNADDRKNKHPEMKAARENFEKEMRQTLTQEQAVKWDELKKERRAKHAHHRSEMK